MQKVTQFRKMAAKKGLRGLDISKESGASQPTICRQMTLGIKTIRVAKRYAAILNCSPFELLEV